MKPSSVPTPAPEPKANDDDDIDLFGSEDEEESEETKKRLADYAAKKATSKRERQKRGSSTFVCSSRCAETQVIAKSTIVLDVKPWDDETDLQAMEKAVRSIEADGLVWGQCLSLSLSPTSKHRPLFFFF